MRPWVPRRPPGRASAYSGQSFSQNSLPGGPDPTDQADSDDQGGKKGQPNDDQDPNLRSTILKMMESAATTFASIAVLGYISLYIILIAVAY